MVGPWCLGRKLLSSSVFYKTQNSQDTDFFLNKLPMILPLTKSPNYQDQNDMHIFNKNETESAFV